MELLYGRQQCSRRCRTYLDGWGQVSAWCLPGRDVLIRCFLDSNRWSAWGMRHDWMNVVSWTGVSMMLGCNMMQHGCKTVLQTFDFNVFAFGDADHQSVFGWIFVGFLRIVLIRKMSVWIVRRHTEATFIVEYRGWDRMRVEYVLTYDVHWRPMFECQDPILPVEGDLRLSGETTRNGGTKRNRRLRNVKNYWKTIFIN